MRQYPNKSHRKSVMELKAAFSHCPTVNIRPSSVVWLSLQHRRRGACPRTFKPLNYIKLKQTFVEIEQQKEKKKKHTKCQILVSGFPMT